jgi:hypothetical protein
MSIHVEGPLFDGRAQHAMDEACGDALDDVSAFAEERVLLGTSRSFKTRTPYYETRIETTRLSSEEALVHDNDVIYGAWLEGVGSRNFPETRFEGYHHWRLAKQAVAERGPQIAEIAVQRHLPAMGG